MKKEIAQELYCSLNQMHIVVQTFIKNVECTVANEECWMLLSLVEEKLKSMEGLSDKLIFED